MASISFSMSNKDGTIDVLAAGSQTVTEGTSAPGAGDIEVRINLAQGWTRERAFAAIDTIKRFIMDPGRSTSMPL